MKKSLLKKIRSKYRHGDTVKIVEFSESLEFDGKAITRVPVSHALNGKKCSENTIKAICGYYGIKI